MSLVTNVMFAGVGGQGLILMTRIVSQAAMLDGYDIKSNDVVGLSQRGGMVWGNVRIGEKVFSPNIPPGEGDILVAMEPLEALRWSSNLKEGAVVIQNTKKMYPTLVQQEKAEYPEEDIEELKSKYKVIDINAFEEATNLGKKQVANVMLLGILAQHLDIKLDTWKQVVRDNVPNKALDLNMQAFDFGYHYKL